MCGTIDDHVLADDVVVADDAFRLLATEVEVLRQGSNDTALMHLVVRPHSSTIEDAHKWEDDAVVTDDHVVLDIDEGEYFAVVANFGLGANLGFWTNFACHKFVCLISH